MILLKTQNDVRSFVRSNKDKLLKVLSNDLFKDRRQVKLKSLMFHPDKCSKDPKQFAELLKVVRKVADVNIDKGVQSTLCEEMWELRVLFHEQKYIATEEDVQQFISRYRDEINKFPNDPTCGKSVDVMLKSLGAITTNRKMLCGALNKLHTQAPTKHILRALPGSTSSDELVIFEKIANGNYGATDLVPYLQRDIVATPTYTDIEKVPQNTTRFAIPVSSLVHTMAVQEQQRELPAGVLALSNVGSINQPAILLADPSTPLGENNQPDINTLRAANGFGATVLPEISAWCKAYGPSVLSAGGTALKVGGVIVGTLAGALASAAVIAASGTLYGVKKVGKATVLGIARLSDSIANRLKAWREFQIAEKERVKKLKEEQRRRGVAEVDIPQSDVKYPEWSRRVLVSFIEKEEGRGLYNWVKRMLSEDNDDEVPLLWESERLPTNTTSLKFHQKAAIRVHLPQSGPQHQMMYMGAGSGKTYILLTIALIRRPEFLEESKVLYRMLRQQNVYITNEPLYPEFVLLATSSKALISDYFNTLFVKPIEELPFEIRPLFVKARTLCGEGQEIKDVEATLFRRLKRINIIASKYTSLLTNLERAGVNLQKNKVFAILDECHTIVNTALTQSNASLAIHSQNKLKQKFTEPLMSQRLKFWGCVGATATPFLSTWEATLELYNAVVAGTPYTVDISAVKKLVETKPYDSKFINATARCVAGSRADLKRFSERQSFKPSVRPSELNKELYDKFKYTVVFYDPASNTEEFARMNHENHSVEALSQYYVKNSLLTGAKPPKPRASLVSTRVVTTIKDAHIPSTIMWSATQHTSLDNLELHWKQVLKSKKGQTPTSYQGSKPRSANSRRSNNTRTTSRQGIVKLSEVSPLVEKCIKILNSREGKTVIFAANPDKYGINIVFKILQAVAHHTFLDKSVDVNNGVMILNEDTDKEQVHWGGVAVPGKYNINSCTKDKKSMESILDECRGGGKSRSMSRSDANKLRFRCDSGVGRSSLVLCLGSKYLQGTDLKGAPGIPPPDAMIILGELEDNAKATQLWSRIVRMCGSYDWPKRSVTIHQLSLRYSGEQSCDDRLAVLRTETDRVTPIILQSMKSASIACPALSTTLGITCAGITNSDLAIY